jgi:sulfoxide reductase heme-binding subunit YedZ
VFDQVLWFAARGAGAVSQLMLTASVCFGLVTVTRFAHPEWPRFFNYEMHRRVSLLSVVFLAVHILSAVFDPFAKLGLVAAIVPLASTYRPVQVALGVIALYLFVALIVTSLLRKHIGQRAWRLVHWTSYAMWPLAMLHGITAGTDGTAPWMLVIDVACALAVGASLAWRLQSGTPNRAILPEVVHSSSWRMNGSAASAPDAARGERR